MAWSHCAEDEIADNLQCPACGLTKEAWTLTVNATRTFVVASKGRAKKEKSAWIEVELEGGAGVACELELPDGQIVEAALDDAGVLRQEQLYPGECRVRFPGRATLPAQGEPDAEGWTACETGRRHAFRPRGGQVRVRLVGALFDTDKTFLLPSAMEDIRALRRLYDERKALQVLVTGHTDTTGTPDYNRGLSEERARAMAAFLVDDVDAWTAWYTDQPFSKPWGTREDQHMLATLRDGAGQPYYPGPVDGIAGAGTKDAVRRFQRAHGLADDGSCGPATRRALIGDYMALDGTSLPAGTPLATHGCGETHPAVATGDGVAEAQNRRVEVFLFEGAVDPAPKASCPHGGCAEYAAWVARSGETIDLGDEGEAGPPVRIVPGTLARRGNVAAYLESTGAPLAATSGLILDGVAIEPVWTAPDGKVYFLPPTGLTGPCREVTLVGAGLTCAIEPELRCTDDALEATRSLVEQMAVLREACAARLADDRERGLEAKKIRQRFDLIVSTGHRRFQETLDALEASHGPATDLNAIVVELSRCVKDHGAALDALAPTVSGAQA